MTGGTKMSEWRLHIEARRSVQCRCGYYATEWAAAPDAKKANGCCTKCGHIWTTELTDEDRASLPSHPDPAMRVPVPEENHNEQ